MEEMLNVWIDVANLFGDHKIFLTIAFVIPGLVFMKAYSALAPGKEAKMTEQFFEIITYSTLNYVICAPLLFSFSIILRECFCVVWPLAILVLFISPVVLAVCLFEVRKLSWVQNRFHHPIHSSWDYVFSKPGFQWVVVTLKSGQRVGGKFISESFSSSGTGKRDLYIQEAYHINKDEGFERKKIMSKGVLIANEEISTIDFYNTEEGMCDE